MSTKAKKSLYGVLGVASWADLETIRKAYQRKVKECHPDRFPDKAEEFKAVQEAWDVLGNEEKRAYYDEHGEVPNEGKADNSHKWIIEHIDYAFGVAVATAMEHGVPLVNIDMVKALVEHFKDATDKGKTQMEMLLKIIKELKRTVGRYRNRKKDEGNILEDLTRARIKNMESQIDEICKAIEGYKTCSEFLKDYSFLKESTGPLGGADFDERVRKWKEEFDKPKMLGGK